MHAKTVSALAAGAATALAATAIAAGANPGAMGGAHAAAVHTVVLRHDAFNPGTVSIRRGDSVRWVWGENVLHNVTASAFHSRTQTHGSYTFRFTRSGTFNYRCTVHPHMTGRVVVH